MIAYWIFIYGGEQTTAQRLNMMNQRNESNMQPVNSIQNSERIRSNSTSSRTNSMHSNSGEWKRLDFIMHLFY